MSHAGSSKSSLLSGTPDAEIAAEVRALSRAEEARRLAAAVAKDPSIEEHSPGLGPLLARHVEAAWALSAQHAELQEKEQRVKNDTRTFPVTRTLRNRIFCTHAISERPEELVTEAQLVFLSSISYVLDLGIVVFY